MKISPWTVLAAMVFATGVAMPWTAAGQDEAKQDSQLLRAGFTFQGNASAPLQFGSYLADGGTARFPVDCGPGQVWIAEVGTKSVKGKGRVLVVEIEDLYRLRERMDGGATKLTPVTILAVEIPYVMGKVMSVLETPLFSVSVSVSAVGARGRR